MPAVIIDALILLYPVLYKDYIYSIVININFKLRADS